MTSTELAAQIAASPRFRNIEAGYFDEIAAEHGRDVAGIAFIQAALKVDQDRETIRQMLTKRYHGAIPVTDEMIDAVLDGLVRSA